MARGSFKTSNRIRGEPTALAVGPGNIDRFAAQPDDSAFDSLF